MTSTVSASSVSPSFQFKEFSEAHREAVIALWQECGLLRPWNDPNKDIDRKLTDKQGRFWLLFDRENLVGSVMVGYDGHRAAINYLSVAPTHQRSGCGRLMMEQCEQFLISIGCPKINLMVRSTNLTAKDFYERLGFVVEDSICLGKRLIPDN